MTGQVIGQTLGSYLPQTWHDVRRGGLSDGSSGRAGRLARMRWRQRRWCTLDEAVTLLSAHPVMPLLGDARAKI